MKNWLVNSYKAALEAIPVLFYFPTYFLKTIKDSWRLAKVAKAGDAVIADGQVRADEIKAKCQEMKLRRREAMAERVVEIDSWPTENIDNIECVTTTKIKKNN